MLSPRLLVALHFKKNHGYFPNLSAPKTFSEKLQRAKLYDADPDIQRLSDKIAVKEYVRAQLGDEWVTPTLWYGDKLPPREERSWPVPYALKAAHGSGGASGPRI